MSQRRELILVDEQDNIIGTAGKLEAHRKGLLHRAFSVFVFDREGRMLLQKRAAGKYHSAGLWTNACCSHPIPNETVINAAHRRLYEEMGFDCSLTEIGSFIYREALDNFLTEYEYDHILKGIYQGIIIPNSAEVSAYRWVDLNVLRQELYYSPEQFTVWFRIIMKKFLIEGK
jgi:isopentenyl-diphosphate delta-isomerase